jgi:hypothetical protein
MSAYTISATLKIGTGSRYRLAGFSRRTASLKRPVENREDKFAPGAKQEEARLDVALD